MDNYTIAKATFDNGSFIRRNYKVNKPTYFLFRIMRPMLKLYNWSWRKNKGKVPWTSPASIRIFEKVLNSQMTGFEYGSGASTAFFASRLGRLISVEHDKGWYDRVKYDVDKLDNVEYFLIEPDSGNEDFITYASKIAEYPDELFDFVLVDGRARVTCCKNAIPKIKKGGILVLDNSERSYYAEIFESLSSWKMITTTTGLTDTTFWFKP